MIRMIPRLLQLPSDESFFLFGPRGVGKTTLLKQLPLFANSLYINLLKAGEEQRFAKNPDELLFIVQGLPAHITHVIIDEVQKLPKLLDLVHELIETTSKHFILTGSSARRLKHGGANLLAGRAFVYHLYPFCFLEVAAQTNGKLVNFSNIARDVGVADQTIQKYFSLLEDTLLGFLLEPFQHSFRKRLSKPPKFYFF